jgi:ketosteroid isomerase-like protein
MKKLILFSLLLIAGKVEAQKNIDGLINAEKNFAALSVANGTKDAFLNFLDTTGIVFEKGQPVNGIRSWSNREKRPGILNWHPQFAEIASSNDLGYTTGPWTFQPKSLSDSIVARGQYTTVWQLNKKGEWKFLIDLGVSYTAVNTSDAVEKINGSKQKERPAQLETVIQAEQDFMELFKQSPPAAYKKYLSAQSILNRNNHLPATTTENQLTLINETPLVQLAISGSDIAGSGDLAYIYGTAINNNKPENFLHIWRKEKEGWKIALEVLRF